MTSVESVTVADWRQRIECCRKVGAVTGTPGSIKREFTLLMRRFRELTLRTRAAHASPWIGQGALAPLRLRLQHCLGLSQLLAEEFQSSAHIPPAVVEELLNENSSALLRVEQQLLLCDLTHESAESLHPLIDQMVYGGESSARRLLNLADEFVTSIRECPVMPAVIPCESRLLAASLMEAGWTRDDWFAQGVLSARLVAEFSRTVADFDLPLVRTIAAAALSQDLGAWHRPPMRLPEPASTSGAAQGGRRRADPNHPGIGAAIMAGLADAPAGLSLLIGSHHERVDGTGFPQRLAGSRLSYEARWLGLIVRFVEWVTDPVSQELATEHGEELALVAGLRLWREVRRGSFPESMATDLLNAIEPGLAAGISDRYAARQLRMVDGRHRVPEPPGWPQAESPSVGGIRTDQPSSESVIEAPAFFRRQRDGLRRAAVVPQHSAALRPRTAVLTGEVTTR